MGNLRKVLIINEVERSFVCDPEKDSLADIIRRLGLTGTKIGCGTGQCGACNVILNGKLVRSCVRKIGKVEDRSTVYTIEGMGTPDHLHPLQLAWILYGGVQCGFCTPGFIVSSKALLDINLSPTRDDVRAWFKKNRNACRCTGYKPFIDAVMAAAEVMRGEKTMEDLLALVPKDKVFNTKAPKPTALGKVLGQTDYGDDIALKTPGALHGAVVLSPVDHGRILGINTEEAEKAPGVVKVVTHKDVKGSNLIRFHSGTGWANGADYSRPIFCDKKVYRKGDMIAVVIADTRNHAREAAALVKVEYEELPAYMNALDAVALGATHIQDHLDNLFIEKPLFLGKDTREVFKDAAYSAEFSFASQRQSHLPIEPETALAFKEADGTLTIMLKTHNLYMQRDFITEGIGYPKDKIRMILNPSGGAFGYAMSSATAAVIGVCALAVDAPVSITMSYKEHQQFTGKRNAAYGNARICCDENGKMLAGELDILSDAGCYPENGGLLSTLTLKFFLYPYAVNSARILSRVAFTNTPPAVAYRCPCAVNVYATVEQLVDILAEKVGMDPLEFRYKNCWREGDIAVYGEEPTIYIVESIIKNMRAKYEALKKDAAENSTPAKKRGVGVAMGSFTVASDGDRAEVALELNPDGTVTHYNTWEDLGQGADIGTLAYTHEALKPLGLTKDQIKMVTNDTKYCPDTGRAAGSRSNFMMSHAVRKAADGLLNAMKKEDGTYRTYDEMVTEGIPTRYAGLVMMPRNPKVDENTGLGKISPDQTNAGFISEVEVDTATGEVKVLELHCVTDIGIITNYLSVEGQAYSGMMHSLGYALSEDFSDMEKHTSLAACGFPYADDVPDGEHFTVSLTETPRDYSPFGGSGASEVFQSSGNVAILNAINNAVGIRVDNQPATKEKVKAAMDRKATGTYELPAKYAFTANYNERLDYMKANPPVKYTGGVDLH